MLTSQLPGVLRKSLGPHWEFALDGDHLTIEHPHRGTPYRPPRRPCPGQNSWPPWNPPSPTSASPALHHSLCAGAVRLN
ncbi:hypothetical protein ABZT23_08250 [Streptomyces sp. NPDC005386]|uniref:hypothetical protein n=1 Tax=Streptomyces sp. NPDC005386 TaxID=3154562 RepID=UPI0033B11BAE